MEYCNKHNRVLVPGGWKTHLRETLPDQWDNASSAVLFWAHVLQKKFPNEVKISVVACDECHKEKMS